MNVRVLLVLGTLLSLNALVGCKGACVMDEGTGRPTENCIDDYSQSTCGKMSDAKFHSGSCAQAGYADRGDGIKVKAGAKAPPKK